jgi:hypothetical protein
MFFSLSSAMVIRHLRGDRDFVIKEGIFREIWSTRGRKAGLVLRSPPLCLNKMFWLRQNRLSLRACDPIQHFVHGFLDAGIRLMKLTGSLGGKLTEHITVP